MRWCWGGLQRACAFFECGTCGLRPQVADVTTHSLEVDDGVGLGRVGELCCLGGMLDAGGGSDLAVAAGVEHAWGSVESSRPIYRQNGSP
jgi:hypothetical protein